MEVGRIIIAVDVWGVCVHGEGVTVRNRVIKLSLHISHPAEASATAWRYCGGTGKEGEGGPVYFSEPRETIRVCVCEHI